MKKSILFILMLLGMQGGLFAQRPSNLSLKFLGLTMHPFGDRTANLQPYKLDPNAMFVLNFGGALGYERFIFQDRISVKGLQAVFADCSAGLASVTHVAIRGTFLKRKGHRLSVGVGPAFMVRQHWGRLPDYKSSGFMKEGYIKPFGPVQYKMFWYGVEIEYDVRLGEHVDFSASLTPGIPMAVTVGAGLKYWFGREYKEKIYLPKIK
jgi:hypothetical protein